MTKSTLLSCFLLCSTALIAENAEILALINKLPTKEYLESSLKLPEGANPTGGNNWNPSISNKVFSINKKAIQVSIKFTSLVHRIEIGKPVASYPSLLQYCRKIGLSNGTVKYSIAQFPAHTGIGEFYILADKDGQITEKSHREPHSKAEISTKRSNRSMHSGE